MKTFSRVVLPFCLSFSLGACAPAPQVDNPSRAISMANDLPAARSFASSRVTPPRRANADIARDFLSLAFELESGRALSRFTRFEGPITLRLAGRPSAALRADARRLVARLRAEAGIDIALTSRADASITIESVSRKRIRRELPQAACFVAPNVSSLAEYRSARRSARTNWAALRDRTRLAIFVPSDSTPQEARDCLHEELAQALGPLNDLYRLPDSVFNDDNVHTVLTGFDMLILRAYYDPALANGMTRPEVAARLPAILARLNPAGEGRAPRYAANTPRAWIEAVQTALGPGAAPATRRAAAARALAIAEAQGWQDNRRAVSHYALGRLLQSSDPDRAWRQFLLADEFYGLDPDTRLHRAYVASQLAAHDLRAGRSAAALERVSANLDIAAGSENAALLATLLMIRAEAYDAQGRPAEARAARLDSLGWARYGFGPDWAVRAKQREIAALNPLRH